MHNICRLFPIRSLLHSKTHGLKGTEQLFVVLELLLQTGGCAREEIENTGCLKFVNDLEAFLPIL